MVRKLGREEYIERENLQQYFLSCDIDEVIKKILENPSEELIHQLMYYVELRTLRNFKNNFIFLKETSENLKNEFTNTF